MLWPSGINALCKSVEFYDLNVQLTPDLLDMPDMPAYTVINFRRNYVSNNA